MEITSGKQGGALKVVVYGPEGIGKSTFASQFPQPVFIDTEGSTRHMDVSRTQKPTSWTMLLEQVRSLKATPNQFKTLVVDTADWAEQLCAAELCSKAQKSGIEDFGYGKGYVYLGEEFGKLLNLLGEVVEGGTNVVLTAHAWMRKFEQPDEMGSYDRWEMKLGKKTAPLLKEWADLVLFANYKTYVVNVDNQGVQKGKNKVQGGKRVMYTTHHPCWDAKNRQGLPDELPFDFKEIAHCLDAHQSPAQTPPPPAPPQQEPPAPQETTKTTPEAPAAEAGYYDGLPRALADLMQDKGVKREEIQAVVEAKGYYPKGTPIGNYDPDFVSGVLVGAWEQVYATILKMQPLPF